MLATCEYPELSNVLKKFLINRTWGSTSQAASIIVREGLETIEALQVLLQDPSPVVSSQAAYLLAIHFQDQDALKVLQRLYKSSSRVFKERVLYAIGSFGSSAALPFLVKVLDEPFESLRVAAARAIIQCLGN